MKLFIDIKLNMEVVERTLAKDAAERTLNMETSERKDMKDQMETTLS